jgi:uncharacterized protein (TIGR03086 family)
VRSVAGGAALLERAARYALASLGAVTDDGLAAPTPCSAWDLRDLLDHLADSADALTDLIATHRTSVVSTQPVQDNPIAAVRRRTRSLIEACRSADRADGFCEIGDRLVLVGTAAGVGAIELAVHGWDVARACRIDRPVPDPLARTLRYLAADVVPPDGRWPEFGVPLAVRPPSSASDRLLAYLGRDPCTDIATNTQEPA